MAGRYFDYSSPVPIANTDAGLDHHPRFNWVSGRLGKLLKDRRPVEVEPLAPTRFNTLNNTGTTIDRFFVNTAPCFLKLCKWSSSILQDPKKMYTSGISDHGIVQARACFSSAPPRGEGIIPLPYINCSTFQKIFQQLSYETRVRSIVCPWEQKKTIVEIIKAAAMFTREHLQDNAVEADIFLKDQLLASISRVIWTQNISIATNMIDSSPIAANYLKVSSSDDGFPTSVFLKDSSAFSEICNSTRTLVISKLTSEKEVLENELLLLKQENTDLAIQSSKSQAEKEHIEQIYQDALKLEHENEKHIQEKLQLRAELQLADNNTQIQKDTSSRNWFIVGAIVLFFGMIIGFIVPGILNRKRY